MKSFILRVMSLFMLFTGSAFILDASLVVLGYNTIGGVNPYTGITWWNSPIFHYNISNLATILLLLLGGMALFVGFFIAAMLKPAKPLKINSICLFVMISLFCLSSCSVAMPKSKKDCKGIKHYRQSNGVYVKCDQGHTHIDSTKTKFFRPKHSLTH